MSFRVVLKNKAGDERVAFSPAKVVALQWDGYKIQEDAAEVPAAEDPKQKDREADVDAEIARSKGADAAPKPRPTAPKN
jgi:alanine dehydrogenase